MGSNPTEEDLIQLPRSALRLPIELVLPEGFEVESVETWPHVEGRLEYVEGRLLFMPPCGDVQQDVCGAVIGLLFAWARQQVEFIVAGNEAGMLLRRNVRGADAAVWRKADAATRTGGFRRTPPVLAVEVSGLDENETALRKKAAWYLAGGVKLVWIVLTDSREVVVCSETGEERIPASGTLVGSTHLPSLSIQVADLFRQLG